MKLLGITQSAFDPAARFRFIQFIPFLREAGWEVEHRPNRPDRQWKSPFHSRLPRAIHYRMGRLIMRANRLRDVLGMNAFDAIFVSRDFASEGLFLQQFFRPIIRSAIYDFDDALFVGPKEKVVANMCAQARWVTPGNAYLASFARQFTDRVTIIPTVIDTDAYVARQYNGTTSRGSNGRVRVGWSGSDQSILGTLLPHLPMLMRLQQQLDFELIVITNTKPRLAATGLRWSFHPWRRENEPLLESKFDIGIMPLEQDKFQKGKCALKLLQYMAAGLPTVASPVGVNQEVVQHGVTGMLASTETEWHESLEVLIRNKDQRAAMGVAGRKRCEDHYSIRRWLPILLDILAKVARENQLSREIGI